MDVNRSSSVCVCVCVHERDECTYSIVEDNVYDDETTT